ncbi:MAG TPA: response regulator [Methylomirabilota bacterium]|nr:response regulator [Methylomirabilota bacterium]
MRTARVLVVEDDALSRFGVRDLLERDFEIVEAANGKEALACLGAQAVDVVVTDVMMPEVDGVELTRAIRARGRTPVIWCTAYDRDELRRQAKELGVDAYLLKPLDLDVLYRTVTALTEADA